MSGNALLIIVVALVFALALMTAQGIYWYVRSRKEQEAADLARRLGTLGAGGDAPLLRLVEPRKRGEKPTLRDRVDDLLVQAGGPMTPRALFARMWIFGVAGALLTLWALKGPLGIVGAGFALLPIARLRGQAQARSLAISEQLPDALDLIGRSLRAGHGLSEAFRMCAEELQPPLSLEFARVYEEHALGRDFREAMQGLTRRCSANFDLKLFVSAVLLQRDTGGNLIEILENIAQTIRARFMFYGKVRSLTAEARFSAWVLGGLPFLVAGLILWMRPAYLKPLVVDPFGRLMLGYLVVSFLIGIFTMREIAKVDV